MATDEQVFVLLPFLSGQKRRLCRLSSRFSSPWTAKDRLLFAFDTQPLTRGCDPLRNGCQSPDWRKPGYALVAPC